MVHYNIIKHSKYLIYEMNDFLIFFDKKTFNFVKGLFRGSQRGLWAVKFDWDYSTNEIRIKQVSRRSKKEYPNLKVPSFEITCKYNERFEVIEYEEPEKGNWWSKEVFDTDNPYENIDMEPIITSLSDSLRGLKIIFWERCDLKLDVNYMPEYRAIMCLSGQLKVLINLHGDVSNVVSEIFKIK